MTKIIQNTPVSVHCKKKNKISSWRSTGRKISSITITARAGEIIHNYSRQVNFQHSTLDRRYISIRMSDHARPGLKFNIVYTGLLMGLIFCRHEGYLIPVKSIANIIIYNGIYFIM